MGVGSGIIYDSLASDEYAECTVKADFLTKTTPIEFDILEAIYGITDINALTTFTTHSRLSKLLSVSLRSGNCTQYTYPTTEC